MGAKVDIVEVLKFDPIPLSFRGEYEGGTLSRRLWERGIESRYQTIDSMAIFLTG